MVDLLQEFLGLKNSPFHLNGVVYVASTLISANPIQRKKSFQLTFLAIQ